MNKYAKSEKDKRAAEAVDNLDIVLKSRFASDSKETTEVMGLKIEAKQLIWILINEDSDKELAGDIAAIFQSLEQSENTIRPLCSGAIQNRIKILDNQVDSINNIYETLVSCFVDNHEDLGELLVDKTERN